MNLAAPEPAPIMVELRLDPRRFPARESLMPLVATMASLGRMDCIEFAFAPTGGGQMGFLIYAKSLARLRETLGHLVGEESIVEFRAVGA